ncbi:MAG: lipoprotein-releasing system transmembrane subunit LolC [SAR86 cluster bacterium]|uniref:Lipoprotein-releasing system transmembrane subunit LolC n=1 Tax=SAR86 cluster bacterium TaxID=2030880 RepID=A0A2A4X9V4_9GAMM|nr:MAG: lipoprotein-releasing system transmembrane subunit LolC [SAR86 cluster bacterium]
MLKPFSVFVGLRYTLARKRNFFLSFVSLISMLGVSLGVMILIVALSVMNGSIDTLRADALKSVPHVTVAGDRVTTNWNELANIALSSPNVISAAPYLEGEANILYQGNNRFVSLRGVEGVLEADVVDNPSSRYRDLLMALSETENGIILGAQLAGSLGIVSSADLSVTALGSLLARNLADTEGFTVVGFADFGAYGNSDTALINLAQAQQLFALNSASQLQLRLRVDDVFNAKAIAEDLFADYPDLSVQSWDEAQASLFNALRMEKVLTSFMLLMIVVVGAVNIVSTLVMVVADKGADVAILRTMGASRSTIMKIFVVQGLVAGFLGTLIGAILGTLLAANITDISLVLERIINSLASDSNRYFISHLQTQIDWGEVALICIAALTISFLATLYPAYRASKIQAAEVLRYE